MNIASLAVKEIAYSRIYFLLSVTAAAAATATFLVTSALLTSTDLRTDEIIARKITETEQEMAKLEDEIRKHMKGLGFNIYVFPEGQDMSEVYDKGYASRTMPEAYAEKLANSSIVSINHLLPTLTRKVVWPEHNRTVILIGIRGEIPMAHKSLREPMMDPVQKGYIVPGYELHKSLGIRKGSKIKLMGREFTVSKTHAERGTTDDITIWMNLAECQELLGLHGRINAIHALECTCAAGTVDRLGRIRKDLLEILPGTTIVEKGSRALARAEARAAAAETAGKQIASIKEQRDALKTKRESLAAVLVPLIGTMALAGICLLAFLNARDRVYEIGIFLAIGMSSLRLLALFLLKAFVTGLGGGITGVAAAMLIISTTGDRYFNGYGTAQLMPLDISLLTLVAMPLLVCLASWLPSFWASRRDPAEILRNE